MTVHAVALLRRVRLAGQLFEGGLGGSLDVGPGEIGRALRESAKATSHRRSGGEPDTGWQPTGAAM